MKVIVMLSPSGILKQGTPDSKMVLALAAICQQGYPVGVISNHEEPGWFGKAFGGTKVQFIKETGRQNGSIVSRNAKKFGLHSFNTLVLAVTSDDVAMGKNGGALLLGAGWSSDPQVQGLGVQIDSPADLLEVVALTAEWGGHWYFSADTPQYNVRVLSDLSSKKWGLTAPQQEFAHALTNTVKNGGSKLKALVALTARSLLMEGFPDESKLLFSTYPSSKSTNNDKEVLSDFVHRLRTTVSRVRMAKHGEPLFFRHKPSPKRSSGAGGDRTDPTDQLLTIHLNPYYRQGNKLKGRHVIVVDDCTTYGVSFGVAAAFLLAAGASFVTGVALGKFGNQTLQYKIHISGDPFAPLSKDAFKVLEKISMTGNTDSSAQKDLQDMIG